MSNRVMVLRVVALVWLLSSCVGPVAHAESVKRAVLIGIDEYLSEEVSDLRGCGNDVDLMKSVLIGKFDFAPEDVVVLKDEEATRAAILGALRSHLGQSRPGDIALVHYSGHGSQMEDRSGDEADGKDETIVPHDSRLGDVFDISDDEINGLMKEISDKTSNVVFILDSCHSGTAARAVASGNVPRKTPADERPPPEPEAWALGARGLEESADEFRLPGANYVLISGCRANELSNETRFDGARHGAMTFFLARALRAAQENTTYRDVMEQVKADVNARFALQHPQLEGTGTQVKLFGTDEILAEPYVLVEPDGDGAIVHAGAIFGVEPGQELRVYPPGTKSFGEGVGTTGVVRVDRVDDFTSKAILLEGEVAAHSRTVLDEVRPPSYRAGVYFEGRDSSDLLQRVAEAVSDDETLEVVADPGVAEMRVSIEGEGSEETIVTRGREGQELSVATPSTGDELVLACDGSRVPSPFRGTPGASREGVLQEKAVAQLRHWARWFGLLAIDNLAGGDLPMDFRVERVGAAEGEAAPETLAPGEEVRIEVINRSDRPAFLTLLDFWSNGRVCVQYPGALPEPLEPGEVWDVTLRAEVPEGRDESVDILKAILTTEPLPASLFELGAAPRALVASGSTQGTVPTTGWSTQTRVLRVARAEVENRGFIAHYESAEVASRAANTLSRSGSGVRGEGAFSGDPTMVEISTPVTRGERADRGSVGAIFEEAYAYREEACASDPTACPIRVEPLLELELERSQTAPLLADEGVRGGGGDEHLETAKSDTFWSHKYTRVPEAWEHLRSLGRTAGEEAAGVLIAHPDTGYLPHPEIWEPASERPILQDEGWDYLDGDDVPVDSTEKERLLDNPVHGTGSSSAIISRPACQLEGVDQCPTGVAQGAKLVPLRVNSSVINFSGKRLAQALLDASVDGPNAPRPRIKVDTDLAAIAMGGPPSWALWKAARTAEERGFIVIAAAGNYVRTVVWPARYDSVISVAAVNADCRPWAHSSRGGAVDIAAPGESVWRATIDKEEVQITGMGKGTTYATATTGGVAALWVAKHKGTPRYVALKERGLLARTLRWLLQETSWRPPTDRVPEGVACREGVGWNDGKFGAGIIDARALLEAELPTPEELEEALAESGQRGGTRGDGQARTVDSIEQLPLWGSLYPDGASRDLAASDYRELFAIDEAAEDPLGEVARYEAEILYHYATHEPFTEAVDDIVLRGRRDGAAFALVRQRLEAQDLSKSLRSALR